MLPWKRRRAERELEEELRAHMTLEARDRIADGEAPEAAALAARRSLGNLAHIQEETRSVWGWTAIAPFFEDMRRGLRTLRTAPGFTAVISATLILGIGLTTAIFSLVYSVLLQPLPYPEPARIVALWSTTASPGMPRINVSAADWLDWRAQSRSFEDIALTRPTANFNLTGDGPPERLQGARTSWNLPRVLGMPPLMGRAFTEQEQWSDARVAILSYRLWERRFGRDLRILGHTINLNGAPFEVVGIMPRDYRYPNGDFELWTPLYIQPQELQERLGHDYLSVGRLKPGISIEQAQSEMSAVMRSLADRYPGPNHLFGGSNGILLEPLLETTVGRVRGTLYVLFAAVGCLLLIGCANLGNLLIARASARSREMAVRAALGAGAGRLARQMLAEVLPLSAIGAAGGLLLASWLLHAMVPLLPPNMPRLESIGLSGWVLAFAVALSVAVVVAAGMLPARIAARVQLASALQAGSRTVSGSRGVRDLLVAGQVAVTLLLLFAGGLFMRSMSALLEVRPGYSTDGVLTMHLAITRAKYPQDTDVAAYCRRLIERVKSIPGVTEAGMINRLPLSGTEQTGPVEFEGRPEAGVVNTDWRSATPGYFHAMSIALVRGRVFTERDQQGAAPVGLIDDQLARQVFGAQDPVGKRFRYAVGDLHGPWVEIAGVVSHIRNGLEDDPRPQVYWPLAQRTQDRQVLVVRTAGHPESFSSAVVGQIRAEDPGQPVYDIRSMKEWLGRNLRSRDLLTTLVALFAGASLLLACLGLYGVVSYSAGLRLREFGIRIALGADGRDIRRLVLLHAGRLAIFGCAAGLALAWPVGRALRSLLYGVTPLDWPSLLAAPAILIAVAVLAGLSPARRASKADPALTLRA
jgi:putative ABC transport system permease protein